MSALPCPTCQCRLPNVAALAVDSHPSVGEILEIANTGIDLWPRLQSCTECLHGRSRQMHAMYEKIIAILRSSSEAVARYRASMAETVDREGHANEEVSVDRCKSATDSATVSSAPADLHLPRVMFGEHRLDRVHSITLIQSVYMVTLKRMASILYEMRRVFATIDPELHGSISDTLYNIIHLTQPSRGKLTD